MGVTLNGDPLAKRIAIFVVITGDGAMPLTLSKRKKCGKTLIPSFVPKQPSALTNHHKLTRIKVDMCGYEEISAKGQ